MAGPPQTNEIVPVALPTDETSIDGGTGGAYDARRADLPPATERGGTP
jgi:hypothetical protein